MDDYTVPLPDDPPRKVQSDVIGFMCAIVADSELLALERELLSLKADMEHEASGPILELHGYDIVSGKGVWKNLPIPTRVGCLESVLRIARRHEVHFVTEPVQRNGSGFRAARALLHSKVQGRISQRAANRLHEDAEPGLSLATVTRSAALHFAVERLGASSLRLVQDAGVPLEAEIDARKVLGRLNVRLFSPSGGRWGYVPMEYCLNQDSRKVPGLQLADIAATAGRLVIKITTRTMRVEEASGIIHRGQFDPFCAEFLSRDVRSLMGEGRYMHSAL